MTCPFLACPKIVTITGLDTVEEASQSIISTMAAFGIESNNTMSIIDKFNEVGNNFSITSAGIGDALQRSASALYASGNTIDESIALITGANQVVQNPEVVGTAFKTLALRLRGAKTELEEAGEDVEGMAESTSQLQAKLKALTGGKVDIMASADEFKSTTQILREMAAVWDDMSDIDQAAALELMGGKRQANVLASLLNDFETVENAIETSMNSSGSAIAENEKWLDSIEGKTYQFTNALQTMWSNMLDSEIIKGFIDFGTDVIQFLDTGAGKAIAFAAAFKLIAKYKGFSMKGIAQGLGDTIKQITTAQQRIQALSSVAPVNGQVLPQESIDRYAQAVAGLTAKQQANLLASQNLTKHDIQRVLQVNKCTEAEQREALAHVRTSATKQQEVAASQALFNSKTREMAATYRNKAMTLQGAAASEAAAAANLLEEAASKKATSADVLEMITKSKLKAETKQQIIAELSLTGAKKAGEAANYGLLSSIEALYASNPVGWIMAIISAVIMLISWVSTFSEKAAQAAEQVKQQAEEITQAYKDATEEIKNNLETLGATDEISIDGLDKEFTKLAAGVDKYGNNLSLTSDQYERYKTLCEQMVGINPKIAEGYDSATKAIGNNASALSQLIELQKIQQRNAVKELISSDNLDTIARSTFENIKTYKRDNPLPYGDAKWDFMSEFASAAWNYDLSHGPQDNYDLFKALSPEGYTWTDYHGYGHDYTYAQNFASDFYDQIVEDLRSEESKLKEYFTSEEINNLLDIADQYDKNLEQYNNKINSYKDAFIDTLLQAPYAEEEYDDLSVDSKGFLAKWIQNSEMFKVDPDATEEALEQQLEDSVAIVQELVKTIADENVQAIVGELENLDESSITAREYLDKVRSAAFSIWDAIGGEDNQYGIASKIDIEKMLGVDAEAEAKEWADAITSIQGYLSDKIDVAGQFNYKTMTKQQMNAFLGIDWSAIGEDNIKSAADVWEKINGVIGGNDNVTKTYFALSERIDTYKDILTQTSEIVADNTEVTQEYKDSLIELGISEDELAEYFDENNELIVTNAKGLNKLIKSTNKSISNNVKLAKSQAKLEYYELYKQMRDFTRGLDYTSDGYATLNDAQRLQLDSLYEEMDALKVAISRFSMLESKLLGVTNAYTEFEEAQTADADNEYSAQAESMVEAFANALNTGDLGTETARAAMLGLVPEEVYKNLDTVKEKMDAIAKYFNEGELSKYFSIDFDDDGNIEKVDITADDLKQFFEEGKKNGVFTGNWEHFDLSEDITSLEQFAEKMNITEEVAFALFEALENHDAGNLFDPSNILDKFMSGNIEYQAYENAKAMADLQYQLANGTISAEEYAKKMVGLDGQLAAGAITQKEYNSAVEKLKDQLKDGTITQQEYNAAVLGLSNQQDKIAEDAYNQAIAYSEKATALEECNKKLEEYNELLSDQDGLDADGNIIDKEQVERDIQTISQEIATLMDELEQLGEPTEMTLELATEYVQGQLEDVELSIKKLADGNSDVLVKIDAKFGEVKDSDFDLSHFGLSKDSSGNWTGVAEFITSMGLNPEDQATIDAVTDYINLVDAQHTLNLSMGDETESVVDTLKETNRILQSIADKLGVDYTLDVNTNLNTSQVDSFLDTPLSKTISVSIKKVGDWLSGLFADGTVHANGTAHARGTAFANGSWGAPKTETALVGELGPEILVHNGRWTTVGENGAEFTQVKKGDIIFNH